MNAIEPVEVAIRLIELALDLVPHEQVKMLLDDAARKRADAAAALVEAGKFGDGT